VSGEGLSKEEVELHMALVAFTNPLNYEECVRSLKWKLAMDSEINSMDTILLGALLICQQEPKPLESNGILKAKLNELGEVGKYKTRLVSKGYSQQGVHCTEVFTSMA